VKELTQRHRWSTLQPLSNDAPAVTLLQLGPERGLESIDWVAVACPPVGQNFFGPGLLGLGIRPSVSEDGACPIYPISSVLRRNDGHPDLSPVELTPASLASAADVQPTWRVACPRK